MQRAMLGHSARAGLVVLLLFAAPAAQGSHVDLGAVGWACGFGGTPADDCGINAIHDPSFLTRSWIDGDDKVIGVNIGGEARAYPVRMLDNHEIVNDVVGAQRIAVTWCPLCGSAIVFDRVVPINGANALLEFEVSGYLYKHDLVMYDRQTNTLWTQIDGTPIAMWAGSKLVSTHGEATLRMLPSELTTWEDWSKRHPDSTMLSNNGRGYGGSYAGYDDSCRFGISRQSDCDIDGLHPKEQIIGVSAGGAFKAFPTFAVRGSGGVITSDVGTERVVVGTTRGGATWVYAAENRTFTQNGDTWKDQAGGVWNRETGAQIDGDGQLRPLDHREMFWFAWQVHHPETTLWLPENVGAAKPLEGGGQAIPGLSAAVLAAALAIGLAIVRRHWPRDKQQ